MGEVVLVVTALVINMDLRRMRNLYHGLLNQQSIVQQ